MRRSVVVLVVCCPCLGLVDVGSLVLCSQRSKRMSWFRVVLPAVIVHGTFDLQAILIPLEMEDYLTEGARIVTVVVLGVVILLGAASMWTWQWRKFLKDVAVPNRPEDDEEIQRLTVLPDV